MATPFRFASLVLALCAASAHAHEYYGASFVLEHPWAQPTEAGQTSACVFGRFESVTADDRLIGGESMIADKVEIRAAGAAAPLDRTLDGFAIAASKASHLQPNEVCIAYIGLKRPLEWGRAYPLTLVFEHAGRIEVEVSIGGH
jgi:copper(I)-binding protein